MNNKDRRRQEVQAHFGHDDIHVSGFIVNSVYVFPTNEWKEDSVQDFYIDDYDDVYFLKVIASTHDDIEVKNHYGLGYIIIQTTKPLKTIKDLETLLLMLKESDYKSKIDAL